MLPSDFVCMTRIFMALWDTDTGTHFVLGHLASVQKIIRRYYSQEGYKFSSESTDSWKLNIKSHPPALAGPL